MKRIFKLKGELIFFVIISMILGFIIGRTAVDTYRKSNIGMEKLKSSAIKRSRDNTSYIIKELDMASRDEKIIIENIKKIEDYLNKGYVQRIFFVDNDGVVIESTDNLGVKQIDLGSKQYEDIKVQGNTFTSKNIINLNENRYVTITTNGYCDDDFSIMEIWIALCIIIFLILVSGRVRYINRIAKNVRVIAKGDMTKRVDVKYKNELTQLAEDINYMAQEIMEQDASQKEFITNISHDLRTPLTTILGYSKMIEEKKYSNEEELERYVSVINRKGMYLRTLLEDFFDYAKLSSMDIKMDKEVININESIRQLLDGEEISFKEKGLELEVLLNSKSIYTYGDPMLIARAFENLISNAVKYSKGNSKVTIKLKEETIEEISYGVFSVYNIPRENLSDKEVDKLFKRLYKSDSARSKGGSGLGLAICQEIVKCHNGFIKAQKINDGIEFFIGLAEIH
ncbi:sensor histidine kinase [Clostridium frigidicarnis]|uniref:histidine kinase n=1 Tax=Clostridium frigidicarnis TaxID=84698 RepID=A0A1I1AVH1_9CLOT|nr:HAMP domain-containing sensor histidine kinase [Clostridium frigidicarnis]SFB40428.1 Signal transduction histidine kinase [Clostridium frigidicarnis]